MTPEFLGCYLNATTGLIPAWLPTLSFHDVDARDSRFCVVDLAPTTSTEPVSGKLLPPPI